MGQLSSHPPGLPEAGRVCHWVRWELIPLAFVRALCQISFSTLHCRMNAFLGAVVAGKRREAARPLVFLSMLMHREVQGCDSSAKKGRDK